MTTGFTFNYTDPDSGISVPNAWCVIRSVLITNPNPVNSYTQVILAWDIYANQAAFTGSPQKAPLVYNQRIVSYLGDDNWVAYFDPKLAASGKDLMTQAYACLVNSLQIITKV